MDHHPYRRVGLIIYTHWIDKKCKRKPERVREKRKKRYKIIITYNVN